jgi:hypothetical protein
MPAKFRPLFVALLMGTILLGTAATAASAAPRPITFDVFIGDFCFGGRAKNNSFLKVIIHDKDGVQKGREAVEADPAGFWQTCTFLSAGPMAPGDKIDVEVFDTGQKRTFTVPLLTGRVDRGTNVVSGKAPAGSSVTIEAFDFRWDLWGESYDEVVDVVATGGNFTYDFDNSGIDIKGGANVVVFWSNAGDTVHVGRFQIAPFLSLQLGLAQLAGAARPNGLLSITLKNSSGNVLARGNGVGAYGDTTFYGEFADADGEAYKLRGGEKLNAPALGAASSWTVPNIAAQTDVAADKIKGKCFPNQRFLVLSNNPNGFEFGLTFGTAAGNGAWEVDLTDQVNIKRGYRVAVLCYSAGGDEVVGEFMAN